MRDFYGPGSTDVVANLDAQWPSIEAAIAQLRDVGPSGVLRRLVVSLSPYLVVAKGRAPLARELLRGVLADSEGDPGVELLFEAGRCLADTGDLYRAGTVFEEMNEVAQATGDQLQVAHSLAALGQLAMTRGDLVQAERLGRAARDIEVTEGRTTGTSYGSHLLGLVVLDDGRLEEAKRWFLESLAASRSHHDELRVAGDLCNLCEVALVAGDDEIALLHLGEIDAMSSRLPADHLMYQTIAIRAVLALRNGDIDVADDAFSDYRALTQRTENLYEHASSLDGLGAVAMVRGDPTQAAIWFGEAAATRKIIGVTQFAFEAAAFSSYEQAAKQAVGTDRYRRAWQRGARTAAIQPARQPLST